MNSAARTPTALICNKAVEEIVPNIFSFHLEIINYLSFHIKQLGILLGFLLESQVGSWLTLCCNICLK